MESAARRIERLEDALRDLCDAIPDETVASDLPLGVWRDAARAALAERRQPKGGSK